MNGITVNDIRACVKKVGPPMEKTEILQITDHWCVLMIDGEPRAFIDLRIILKSQASSPENQGGL